MTDYLLPCPFCGGRAAREDIPDNRASIDAGASYITCTRCHATTALHFDRKENLVAAWNDRAAPDITEPVYKEIERILDDHRAWIARPDHQVTAKIALACTLAAMKLLRAEFVGEDQQS